VPIDPRRRSRLLKDLAHAPRKAPVAVMEDMTWEEFSRVNIRAPELPGVTADMGEVRVYPFGGAFAHVIGYVAKVSDRDLKKAEADPNQDQALLHHPGFRIGKLGVEKAFDRPCAARPAPTRPRSTPRAAPCAWTPRATSRPRPAPTSA
jgi:penicillin-binding protein 2